MTKRIDISHRTIIFIAIFLLGVWVIYQIIDLVLLLFVSLILMSALTPLVSMLTKVKIPKALSILFVYIFILIILAGLLTVSFTPLINETIKLVRSLPPALGGILKIDQIDQSLIQSQIGGFTGDLISLTKTIFNNILTIVFLLVFTFYLLLERENLEKHASRFFIGQEERVRKLLSEIEEKLGGWLRGQIALSLIIGVVTYIGLFLLQIPYALPLSILAGLLEVVPVIGPILAAIPAVVLALTINPVLGAGVAALYLVIQQLENHLVVPQVMKRAVGLNPLVVILAIAVGGRIL